MIDERTELLPALRRWEGQVADLRARYAGADPFPHIVFDDVFAPELFDRAVEEFPSLDGTGWTNYLHVNETKFGNAKPQTWGPALQAMAGALTAPRFVRFLETLVGIEDLLPDRTMDGGGLHQTLTGGHLNVHTDFTSHHTVPTWRRRVNVLVYLNRTWLPEWGGDLELWPPEMSRPTTSIAPIGNRMLVFTTDERSLHGHPEPLRCPPGVARQSLALYYFTHDDDVVVRSTDYRARPGDGLKAVAIYADTRALRAYDVVKRRFRLSDERLSRLMRRLR